MFKHGWFGATEPQPKADPIGHKDRKKGLGFGRNRPRAYRRDAEYSIHLGFFVLFVAINSSRPASIFEDSNAKHTKSKGRFNREWTRNDANIGWARKQRVAAFTLVLRSLL
jgi:hypothetical protein